jgi:hypothetical protein
MWVLIGPTNPMVNLEESVWEMYNRCKKIISLINLGGTCLDLALCS